MGLQYTYGGVEEEGGGVTSQQILIIVGIALGVVVIGVALIVGAILLSASSRQRAAAPATEEIAFDILTAREAYPPAVEAIRAVDLGAQLASASGAWTPQISRAHLAAGRTGWTFHFYLPASGEMARVVVDRGGGARVAGIQPWETAPQLLDDQLWEIDSGGAMASFLETCESILEGDVSVEARLSTAASNRQLVWRISARNSSGREICAVALDGATGNPR